MIVESETSREERIEREALLIWLYPTLYQVLEFILIPSPATGWLFALAKDVYPNAALMRTISSSDATSDFAVREGHFACMKTLPLVTPRIRSIWRQLLWRW